MTPPARSQPMNPPLEKRGSIVNNVIELNESNFEQEVLRADGPVLVDYWAPWCAPCRVLGPVVERIAEERAGSLTVGKVNVDEEPVLADRAGVRGIPYLVLYAGAEPVGEVVGAHPKHTIERALRLDAPTDRAA